MIELWWWDDNRLHDEPPPPERRPTPDPQRYAWVAKQFRHNQFLGRLQLFTVGVMAGLGVGGVATDDLSMTAWMVLGVAVTLNAYRINRRLRRRLITLAETYGVAL